MSHLSLRPLDLDALIETVAAPDHGGVVTFVGTVRNHHQGRQVTGLSYSAYEPMAESVCEAITAEAERRWPVRIAVVHRLGDLEIGDTAVAIAAGSAHRDEAFAACRYVIEEIKRRVPIWKRERFADGTEEWVDPAQAGGRKQEAGEGISA
jgi:molybdopterin synthase catalytic subunit